MKILSCYIKDFGKLSEFKYDFEDNLNVIGEGNSWGKSTLAAFIKSMFYGLEYTRGAKLTDRKRYRPWNGQKFGGNLTFELNGKKYKVIRFFGRTEKTDTIEVHDLTINKITKEFGDSPGDKIWGVDRDSYENTAFITLEKSELLNDIIASKLGNINDKEADLNKSTVIINKIDAAATEIIRKRGNTGIYDKKIAKISELNQKLRDLRREITELKSVEEYIKEVGTKKVQNKQAIEKTDKERDRLSLNYKKKNYNQLIEDYNTKLKEKEDLEEFFNGKVITEYELKKLEDDNREYNKEIKLLEEYKFSTQEKEEYKQLNKIFYVNTPTRKNLDECNSNINTYLSKVSERSRFENVVGDEEKLACLESKYEENDITEDKIKRFTENMHEVSETDKEISKIKLKLSSQINVLTNSNFMKIMIVIFALILFVGIGLSFASIVLGISLIIVGVLGTTASVFYKVKSTNASTNTLTPTEVKSLPGKLKELESRKSDLLCDYKLFLESINHSPQNDLYFLATCKSEIENYGNLKTQFSKNEIQYNKFTVEIKELKTSIETFLKKFSCAQDVEDYHKSLSRLRLDIDKYNKLSEKNDCYKNSKDKISKNKEYITQIIKRYFDALSEPFDDQVKEISKKYDNLKYSVRAYKDSLERKKRFEFGNDISKFKDLKIDEEKLEDQEVNLKEQRIKLEKERDSLNKELHNLTRKKDKLIERIDEIENIESMVDNLQEEADELKIRHDLLIKAGECMKEAKESLAAKYIEKVSNSFKKYINVLNNVNASHKYSVDIGLKVKVEHQGSIYDSEQLSKGMKDLVQICLRMALVEAVYKDVKNPLLILDDPFVNLDDSRLNNAAKLLDKIRSEYQIIYFTCHTSRKLLV